jgi:type II restriction/modification system DNA methylase subunit YeeA
MGDTKGGPFDLPIEKALFLLEQPNINGRPSSDIITPWCNGKDVTQRGRGVWIVDFGIGTDKETASQYDSVFGYLQSAVKSAREASRSKISSWWLHERPRVEMREALGKYSRYAVTPNVTKYRLFVWMTAPTLADHQLIAFANDDDSFLGILHSRPHELWGLKQGTRLETRPRYTPTTCFETFPFPEPTKKLTETIAAAAKDLDALRTNWLNPPEWTKEDVLEFPGSADGPWKRYVTKPNAMGIGTVRYPRIIPRDDECAAKLKKRTLTNLYNERPAWLANAHKKLDEAVFAAYGWPPDLADDALLAKLLALNLERAKS